MLSGYQLSPIALVTFAPDGLAVAHTAPPHPADLNPPRSRTVDSQDLDALLELSADHPSVGISDDFAEFLREQSLLIESSSPFSANGSPDDAGVVAASQEPALESSDLLRISAGASLTVEQGALVFRSHDGPVALRLSADQAQAVGQFTKATSVADAHEAHTAAGHTSITTYEDFAALAQRATAVGLLRPSDAEAERRDQFAEYFRRVARLQASLRSAIEDHEAATSEDGPRVPIRPVHTSGPVPPLSLGMLLTYAANHGDGRLTGTYDFFPRWLFASNDIRPAETATIYLFSNYLWSHVTNLKLSAEIKTADPRAITIHGGPDCPNYEADTVAYMQANPHVDIAVHGEGEATLAAVLEALGPGLTAGEPDLSVLHDVEGITFRIGDELIRTGDRERMQDLDAVPSPYLNGVFDTFVESRDLPLAIIETNRGCPYGCTFCDWGSATNSRIRKFDLQRIKDEFEWCAQNAVKQIFIADANFGIFARDVEIAQHVADLNQRYGYPQRFITNYAKNTVKHLREIVTIIAGAGIMTEGLLSLQTMDDHTLDVIRRKNIKLEKYDALAGEFRESQLPLFVDLMMGLPGQSHTSLLADFQQCVDREVTAKVHATELLVNSPMNDPKYREEHGVVSIRPAGPHVSDDGTPSRRPALVVQSTSFTATDYESMNRSRHAYLLAENLGVARYVSRYVRHETGMNEVELIERFRTAGETDPQRWPGLATTMGTAPNLLIPPGTWKRYINDVRTFVTTELGVADDAALDSVLRVQHLTLPAPGRSFPAAENLTHDVAEWYRAVLAAKDSGQRTDWPDHVARLSTFGAATFTVDDPFGLCERGLGVGSAVDAYIDWELSHPTARPMPAHYRL